MNQAGVDAFGFPEKLYRDGGSCSNKLSASPIGDARELRYQYYWNHRVAIYYYEARGYIVGQRDGEFFQYEYFCYTDLMAWRMAKDFDKMIEMGEV